MEILKDFCDAGKQDSLKDFANKLGVKENYLITLAEALRVQEKVKHDNINRMFLDKTKFPKMDTLNSLSVGIIR
jgi:hypothetical protein